jgi:hypothetical protein
MNLNSYREKRLLSGEEREMDVALWEPTDIKSNIVYGCKIGSVEIRLRYAQHDWHVASEAVDESSSDRPFKPLRGKKIQEPSSWSRWTSTEESLTAQLVPALPDKPVVVRPEASIRIPGKQTAMFFVGIPLWVRITVGKDRAMNLCEIPTMNLSKTWFGDVISGELGYSLKTRAMRDLSGVEPRASRATCSVLIDNSSASDLTFQRLCLHTEHLALFRSEKRLWANQVNVLYRGEEQGSQIDLTANPPDLEGPCERITDPRVKPDKNLLRKSFQVMKMLTGLEGL